MSGRFSVILSSQDKRDPMGLAKALAAIRKTPLQDQLLPAKRGWGVIETNLEEDAAKQLHLQLQTTGIHCSIVADSDFSQPPAAETIKQLDSGSLTGCLLIAAAAITQTTTTSKTVKQGPSATDKLISTGILLTTGIPINVGPKKTEVRKEQTQSDLVYFVDLITPARRQRIDAQHFDFSFLKERKAFHLLGNVKTLLAEATAQSPAAWKNHGAQLILAGQPLNQMGYQSLADLDREIAWLLTLQKREAA
jgi:hypothetical protein